MTINFDVYAIKLTKENTLRIVEEAARFGWTLDHLYDGMEFNTDYFGVDTTLLMMMWPGTTDIANFNDFPNHDSLDNSYRLTDEKDPKFGIFYKIEKI